MNLTELNEKINELLRDERYDELQEYLDLRLEKVYESKGYKDIAQ